MAFATFKNIRIGGFAAAVPQQEQKSTDYSLWEEKELEKFIATVGIEQKRIAPDGIITSDMCYAAAERLITDIKWEKSEIDCLVFVTQSADYIMPATSCILQQRLGLPEECYTLDVSLGCSGWVYGLSVLASLLSGGGMKKGLLLVGDVSHMHTAWGDKSTYPIFGDAGTATAVEFVENAPGINFHFGTDGKGYDAIIIEDGGYRNFFNTESLNIREDRDGMKRSALDMKMDGMSVFSFAITKVPESIRKLSEYYQIDRENVDFLVMHQANKMMNEKIRKKVGFSEEKTPYSLKNYGNTSSATIPLTIVTECRSKISTSGARMITAGFGVGLSWATAYFELDRQTVISDLVEI